MDRVETVPAALEPTQGLPSSDEISSNREEKRKLSTPEEATQLSYFPLFSLVVVA